MCLGVPARVIEIKGSTAAVDILGAVTEVSAEFVKDIEEGDYVIIHAGSAISKVDGDEAKKTLELFRELGEMGFG